MMTPTDAADAARHECLGYVRFCAQLDQDPQFADWFARLRSDLDDLATAHRGNQVQLIDMQHALIDLIEFLDPDRQRLPAKYRDRLPRQLDQRTPAPDVCQGSWTAPRWLIRLLLVVADGR
jgi:hypothetical protein